MYGYKDVCKKLSNLNGARIPFLKHFSPFKFDLNDIEDIQDVDGGIKLIKPDYIIYLDNNGYVHRDEEPAVIYEDDYIYVNHGIIGHDTRPAAKYNGVELWYKNGKMHREDGPSRVTSDIEEWYLNGRLHREDGPAVTHFKLNIFYWYKNGKLHRSDGPAQYNDHINNYYISGELVTPAFKKWCKKNKCEESNESFEIFAFEYLLR